MKEHGAIAAMAATPEPTKQAPPQVQKLLVAYELLVVDGNAKLNTEACWV